MNKVKTNKSQVLKMDIPTRELTSRMSNTLNPKTLFFLLIFSCIVVTHAQTISVADFGLKPDTRENAVPFVQKAIEACRKNNKPILIFPKGRYDFWPQHCIEREYFMACVDDINPKQLAILIEQTGDLIIDGHGSELVFHGRMQPFAIDGCSNITIRNLSIDWDVPFGTQAIIEAATPNYVDLRINAYESPYVIEDGKLVFTGEGWKRGILTGCIEFDKRTHWVAPQTGDDVFGEGWNNYSGPGWKNYQAEELSKGLVRLHHVFPRLPALGNFLVLRHSERDHTGIFINNSNDVHLEDMNIYHAASHSVLAQHSENLTFSNVNCVPNATKKRIFAAQADGFHFADCKGHITVDRCRWHGLMDDPLNVHGTGVRIIQISGNTLRCQFLHHQSEGLEWACTGDEIKFLNKNTWYTVGTGKIKSFTKIDKKLFDIELEQVPPDNIEPGDGLENITWTPSITISNSFFGSCRARGILVTTPRKVLIENNIFESSGSAIVMEVEPTYFVTGAVEDVTIRSNVFRAPCLTSLYMSCEAIISIYPQMPKVDPTIPYNRNITITGNEFHLFDYPIVYAKSVQGLEFSHNKLIRSYDFEPFHYRKAGLTFEACSQVKVFNNEIKGNILGTNIVLVQTQKKEVKTDKNGVFKL